MKRISAMSATVCFSILALLLIPILSYCQSGDIVPDPDAPIDGGVGVLLAAGVGYGIKKARDARKKKTSGD